MRSFIFGRLAASSRGLHTGEALSQSLRRAIVLLSGGLDSATTLAIARDEGFAVTTLSFDYNQRHRHELAAASTLSSRLGADRHHVAKLDATIFRSSALVDRALVIPKQRSVDCITEADGIPTTYVPARNTLFLSYALALAESSTASAIFIGANSVDYSGYPDCRAEFFDAFRRVAETGTRAGVERGGAPDIRVPLLEWSKQQIIQRGLQLGVDFGLTHSCYDPLREGRPCQKCDACILRAEAFTQLGFRVDPAVERYDRLTAAPPDQRGSQRRA